MMAGFCRTVSCKRSIWFSEYGELNLTQKYAKVCKILAHIKPNKLHWRNAAIYAIGKAA